MHIPSWEEELKRSKLPRLEFASYLYQARNLTKAERENPPLLNGWHVHMYQPKGFNVTNTKYWLPVPIEVRSCCQEIKFPHGAYPWHYHRHCRTLRHVSLLIDVRESQLRKSVGKTSKAGSRCASCSHFRPEDDYLCKTCRQTLDKQYSAL